MRGSQDASGRGSILEGVRVFAGIVLVATFVLLVASVAAAVGLGLCDAVADAPLVVARATPAEAV